MLLTINFIMIWNSEIVTDQEWTVCHRGWAVWHRERAVLHRRCILCDIEGLLLTTHGPRKSQPWAITCCAQLTCPWSYIHVYIIYINVQRSCENYTFPSAFQNSWYFTFGMMIQFVSDDYTIWISNLCPSPALDVQPSYHLPFLL
jgi:hypothetical protein